jgi:hypothetical protein
MRGMWKIYRTLLGLAVCKIYGFNVRNRVSGGKTLLYFSCKVKVKVNLSLCFFFLTEHHTVKEYWGSGGITPRILDLGTI